MDDLTRFLLARLGETMSLAAAATPGPWWHNPRKQWLGPAAFEAYDLHHGEEFVGYGAPSPFVGCVAATGPADDPQSMADAAHIARHHPRRVLDQVEATMRIVKLHYRRRAPDWDEPDVKGFECAQCDDRYPCQTLRLLAVPFADHLDYRQGWRP